MKKKSIFALLITSALLPILSGCSSDEKMSPAEEQKMKAGFSQKGLDPSKLTPEQKAGMEKYAGGLAPKAPAGPSGASK